MEKIIIGTNNGVRVIADNVKVYDKEAQLVIKVQHKNPGDPLDKTTSKKLAEEIAEWLIKREGYQGEILK